MTNVRTAIVQEGDTLERVALRELGSARQWQQLAEINTLRHPYISSNPQDWFGASLESGALSASLASGATSFVFPATKPSVWVLDNLILLDAFVAGVQRFETVRIRRYDVASQTVFLKSALENSYPRGTLLSIHSDPDNQQLKVVKPGDRIVVSVLGSASDIVIDPTETVAGLGQDIKIKDDGLPDLSDGLLATVVGVENVAQALRMRLSTELGELVRHPRYGSLVQQFVGARGETTFQALVKRAIADTIQGDPRVQRVTSVQTVQVGETLFADAEVVLSDGRTLLRLPNLVVV